MTQVDLWTLENELRTPDTEPLCGVDEAGRGPLAGPVCAAAVMLPPGLEIPGLNDSKKLSEKKREALYDTIIAQALSYGIAFATVEEIEAHNILGATFLAMNRACASPSTRWRFRRTTRSSTATGTPASPCRADASSAATASVPTSRRPPCSQRSHVTAICAGWRRPIRSMGLKNTRATARQHTMRPSGRMGQAPSTGRRS